MATFLQILLPKEKKFFLLFEKAAGNLLEISKLLCTFVETPANEKRIELLKEIERLEHVGDNTSHEIFNELGTTFITPFDREDIHELASALDDVVDFIHGSAKRIQLYKVAHIHPNISKLAVLVRKCAEELQESILQLRDLKNVNRIKEACVRINSIENHADDIFDMTIAKLFEDEKDAIEIIKLKEIFTALETATDKCEDAANVLESIIVKNT